MVRVRFRGALSDLDPGQWVSNTPRLAGFRDRLVAGGMDFLDAQRALERLVVGAFDEVSTRYLDDLGHHIDRVTELRGELSTRLDDILALDPADPVPPDLQPAAIDQLFADLETHLDAMQSPAQFADAMDRGTVSLDDVDAAARERMAAEAAGAEDVEAASFAQEAALAARAAEPPAAPTGPPSRRAGEPDLPEPDLPLQEESKAYQELVGKPARDPEYGGRPSAPEDLALRSRLEVEAAQFADDHLPKDWDARLRRLPTADPGSRAQLERLRVDDPRFLDWGYELMIFRPGASRPVRQTDGVRFLDPDTYLLLEHKEWSTAERLQQLRDLAVEVDRTNWRLQRELRTLRDLEDMFRRDMELARELEPAGCRGFDYSTGDPHLDELFRDVIRGIDPSGRLLHVALQPGEGG